MHEETEYRVVLDPAIGAQERLLPHSVPVAAPGGMRGPARWGDGRLLFVSTVSFEAAETEAQQYLLASKS